MSVVNTLEVVRKWLDDKVCDGVLLKPMSMDGPQDEAWKYELVKPSVFTMYVPPHEMRPPGTVATIPSIVIQPQDSRDDLVGEKRELKLRLSFTTFDPGKHGPDKLTPTDDTTFDVESMSTLKLGPYKVGDTRSLEMNMDGWRDAYSFMDRFLRTVESSGDIAGYDLSSKDGISFGPYEYVEDGDIQFPFWACWCSLTLIEPLSRNPDIPDTRNKQINDCL